MLKRTHYCGGISKEQIDKEVVLCGWVDRWRDHGGVVFIDLRDRQGIAQVVFDPSEHVISEAGHLRLEFVIGVRGKVRLRPSGMENPKLPTGFVEVLVEELEVFNRAETPPFSLHEDSPSAGATDEKLRGKYRYLDLRRPELQNNMRIRHELNFATREFYKSEGFWEVETPILYKSTPEGARDYLVPSRVHPGKFFALPQSPQTLKQLCMVSGLDRYFQIARCFRDEDLRADRQPEFTQIDVEMSFIDEEDVYSVHERLISHIFKQVVDFEVPTPFPRMTYQEAMAKYGSDKPDLRNSLTLVDLSEEGKRSDFKVYREALDRGGILKALCFEEKQPVTRKELDGLMAKVRPFGAKGVTWIRIKSPGDWQSPQAKFFDDALKKQIEEKLSFQKGAMMYLLCGDPKIVNLALSYLRGEYGERFGYQSDDPYHFLWVTDFPLLEYNKEEKRYFALHHPFTSPNEDDLPHFMKGTQLDQVRARAYDLVINGYEAGGGSIRTHRSDILSKMFQVLGMSEKEAQHRFGYFLEALKYGTPPHGGIAFGVDRIAMVLAGTDAIRDVIAFPKTQKAACQMSEAPSDVDPEQLEELQLRITLKE